MRKLLTSIALGCAFAAALSVAASACSYEHKTTASNADQTAQTEPASAQD